MSESPAPNEPQIEYWNKVAGPKWVALSDRINGQIEPLGQAAMERLSLKEGEQVLDVGCGCGPTSLELAQRVGASGRVLGVDVSEVMLAEARSRSVDLSQLAFRAADAQSCAFAEAEFDAIFSRFGVMFFSDPESAFLNLLGALRSGGRLGFVCWQEPGRNPWMSIPGRAAAAHVEMEGPPDPHAPGPFAFADGDRVKRILEGAGFEGVVVDAHESTLTVGAGLALDGCVDFLLQMGPAAAALREASPDLASAIRDSVKQAVEPYWRDGSLRMDAAVWLVGAQKA